MTASIDPLTDEVADVINTWIWGSGPSGHVIAAMAVLEVPALRDGLRAAETLTRLAMAHQYRTWSDDSASRSCICGTPGCQVPDAIDKEST